MARKRYDRRPWALTFNALDAALLLVVLASSVPWYVLALVCWPALEWLLLGWAYLREQ